MPQFREPPTINVRLGRWWSCNSYWCAVRVSALVRARNYPRRGLRRRNQTPDLTGSVRCASDTVYSCIHSFICLQNEPLTRPWCISYGSGIQALYTPLSLSLVCARHSYDPNASLDQPSHSVPFRSHGWLTYRAILLQALVGLWLSSHATPVALPKVMYDSV